jgi:hypothetical protein
MAKWVIVQLDSGRLADGSRLFTPRTTRELWTIVTPIPTGNPPAELSFLRSNFNGYALGFGISDYRGRKRITHTGGLPGYVSQVTMMPDQRLGIVVLTNQEATLAFTAITNRILDHYLGAPAVDYLAIYSRMDQRAKAQVAQAGRNAAAQRDSTSRPSLPLARYAGTYEDEWYGNVSIALENGGLVMRMTKTPRLVGDLVHWQHDSFLVKWRERELRADAYLTFALNPDGTIDQAKMLPASPDVDFSFDWQDLLLKPVRSK